MSPLARAIDAFTSTHAPDGYHYRTPVEGLTLMRLEAPSGPLYSTYDACLCLVAQGAKRGAVDGADAGVLNYAEHEGLIVEVDVPMVGHVVRATAEEPFLGLKLTLDVDLLASVAADLTEAAGEADERSGAVRTIRVDAQTEDALTRLLDLAEMPEAAAALRGPRLREVYHWLLRGPSGPALARLARPGGAGRRIAEAVRRMKEAFPSAVRIEDLAEAAGMGRASFHTHFRAVTGMSPLHYYKRLRLLEARRLMATEDDLTARDAAYRVGYESPSQFSRDYARAFGVTPGRDAATSRAGGDGYAYAEARPEPVV